jgi:hypothetical protein
MSGDVGPPGRRTRSPLREGGQRVAKNAKTMTSAGGTRLMTTTTTIADFFTRLQQVWTHAIRTRCATDELSKIQGCIETLNDNFLLKYYFILNIILY